MPIEWKQVLSSNVAEVGYDSETQDLLIRWSKDGKTSAYAGVPPELAEQCSKAWSVGTFLNDEIKNNFPHRYVSI